MVTFLPAERNASVSIDSESNNITHNSAYELKALELAYSTIPSLSPPAHQGCAGSSCQLHLLKMKYWMRDKVVEIECINEIQIAYLKIALEFVNSTIPL